MGHWNKGKKLVFDIDLSFFEYILMKVDKIVYLDMFIKSWQKLGHWNKGKKLVFDINL